MMHVIKTNTLNATDYAEVRNLGFVIFLDSSKHKEVKCNLESFRVTVMYRNKINLGISKNTSTLS